MLRAFNDLGRSTNQENEVIHFYKSDSKLVPILKNPKKYLASFAPYAAVLTPDVTLSSGMPQWLRIANTATSRMVGAVFEHHGLTVIPSLRWSDEDDYDFVSVGSPKRA
jgi:hypothetical protein